ncbi:hypothetical protein [Rhizobium sp. Root1220]|uniref:hypothetical protein n=1 Tax=Rhizobium sp. Root1220 TaxID=1736432 RepID=UPI000701BE20|nr:hypothetical protein [Rhizobium sp. Root1220]KQV83226.1 hypothetical protein ASC90_21780 [Rhizobium sp. Root1220]
MADFNLPFADGGERRAPTVDEQDGGFGCGPANLPLFNWMFWALQSEINAVIMQAGLTPTNADMTQLLQAIQELIDAATGGGDPSGYLTMLQARARLPIFPEVQNVSGHFGVVTPATGQVRIPSGVIFQHRGIYPITTVQTDFATDASKTYHLRWNSTDGFTLKDLAGSYNPGVLAETDVSFDSKYDDMLLARIVTNSSNVPTITNLINKNVIKYAWSRTALIYGDFTTENVEIIPFNFARTPEFYINSFAESGINTAPGQNTDGSETNIYTNTLTRYAVNLSMWSYNHVTNKGGRPAYKASVMAVGG